MRVRFGAALAAAGALALAMSGAGSGVVRPQAPPQHRAAVIIDTGSAVHYVCIRFTADSITGKDALDLANQVDHSVQPVYREYGSLGAFVCALCGTGNPQSDCTGQQSGKFWAYDRAPSGSSKFSQSSMGISSTQVHDGDVEGWYWGKGGAPPYASVDQVCGTLASDGTFTPTSVSRNGGPPQPVSGPGFVVANPRQVPRQLRPPATPATPPPSTTSTTAAPSDSTSSTEPTSSTGPSGTALANLPRHGSGGGSGGTWAGLAAFAAIGTGLTGWYLWVRHARGVAG